MLSLVDYYIIKNEEDWKSSVKKGISREGDEKYYLDGIPFWDVDKNKPDKFPAAYKYDPPYDWHWDDGHVIPCPLKEAITAMKKQCMYYVKFLKKLNKIKEL